MHYESITDFFFDFNILLLINMYLYDARLVKPPCNCV